jgi:carbonic anhydrase
MERRNFLKLGAVALSTATLTTVIGRASNASNPRLARFQQKFIAQSDNVEGMSPDEVLAVLMEGNKRFVAQKRQNPSQDLVRLEELAEGQSPFACILSCADSRVPPEIIFDRGLGDLFVVRDAGNVATPEEIGSLEFGTIVLGAKVLMVMGHQNCGAVKAALKGGSFPGSIGSIVEAILPAVERSSGEAGDPVENAIKANVFLQKERVKSSPVISQLIKEGKLKVVGTYYNLKTGEVTLIS